MTKHVMRFDRRWPTNDGPLMERVRRIEGTCPCKRCRFRRNRLRKPWPVQGLSTWAISQYPGIDDLLSALIDTHPTKEHQ